MAGKNNNVDKVNQDTYFIKKGINSEQRIWLVGVCDGHGSNGHLVSKLLSKQFGNYVEAEDKRLNYKQNERVALPNVSISATIDVNSKQEYMGFDEELLKNRIQQVKQVLRQAYDGIERQLEQQTDFDVYTSGSTLIVIAITDQFIICSNCGDSRALLVSRKPTAAVLDYEITELSIDQKPGCQ